MSLPETILSLYAEGRYLEELLKSNLFLRNPSFTVPMPLALVIPEVFLLRLYGEVVLEGDLIVAGELVVA